MASSLSAPSGDMRLQRRQRRAEAVVNAAPEWSLLSLKSQSVNRRVSWTPISVLTH